ncbi:MAG: molybdopterin-guanine dinucleotide biosynthesis protein B [Dehalococcoidia bacterium]|nr:molybdopterin-guanine dinucleotide biosynthesis protein B [Dehalococcoidia bacterium]
MPPIVSVVGRSNVGKTTFLEKLVAELKRRGRRIGVIKHSASGFEFDQPGKDSWRLARAGSDAVMVSSTEGMALFKRTDHDSRLEEVAHVLGYDYDLVLVEGFKASDAPKIEVHRKEMGSLLFNDHDLLAVATDEHLDVSPPQFSLDDAAGVADLIERQFLAGQADEISLLVNGASIPLTPFVQGFVSNTVLGMVKSLKGVDKVESVEIRVKRGLP